MRGEDGLKVDMMAELPGNVFLADEFPDIFCGFSIGGPSLTRLALGLGRDDGLAGVKGGLKMGMMTELPGNVFLPTSSRTFSVASPSVAPASRGSCSASAATTAWRAPRAASR